MRMMDELEHLGLIERRKQGLGKPNLVYLCNSETIAELLSGADIEIEEWEQGETEHRLTCQICNPEHTVIEDVTETMEIKEESTVSDVTCQICNSEESRVEQIESEDCATDQQYQNWQSQNQNDQMTCQICNFQKYQDCNSNNTEYKNNNRYKHLSIMYTVNHSRVQDRWMDRDCVEAFFRKKWEYDVLLQDGADADLLAVLLAVAVDTCSRRSTTIHRFGRREYTTAELRAQFSKLTMSHIQYVLYSLGQTTTRIHNIRAYLLTSLYNAPDTMTFYYSRKVYEDLGYQPVSNFGNNDKSDPFRISEHRLCQECRKETVCVEVKRMKCPFCGSNRGYYQIERVHRALLFDFDGEPIGGSEDVTDYAGRRKQCIDCHKILPRKLFEEMMET